MLCVLSRKAHCVNVNICEDFSAFRRSQEKGNRAKANVLILVEFAARLLLHCSVALLLLCCCCCYKLRNIINLTSLHWPI